MWSIQLEPASEEKQNRALETNYSLIRTSLLPNETHMDESILMTFVFTSFSFLLFSLFHHHLYSSDTGDFLHSLPFPSLHSLTGRLKLVAHTSGSWMCRLTFVIMEIFRLQFLSSLLYRRQMATALEFNQLTLIRVIQSTWVHLEVGKSMVWSN